MQEKTKDKIDKQQQSKIYVATGRRKEAVARVNLLPGSGAITVNRRNLEEYFPLLSLRTLIKRPLSVTHNLNKFDCLVNIKGGGISGQAEALQLGIARALAKADEGLRSILRKEGLLTRDPRMKERKKYGQKGARKRFQWTKR